MIDMMAKAMPQGTMIMVTRIPTQLAVTLERTNAGRVRGLDSTQAAVPSLFSPTMASCMMMTTPPAGKRPVNMKEIINWASLGGGGWLKAGATGEITERPP